MATPNRITVDSAAPQIHSGALTAHACRLRPGMDFGSALKQAAMQSVGTAGSAVVVLTAVGSLSKLVLRMANASSTTDEMNLFKSWDEPLEIVSLTGTFAVRKGDDIKFHLHLSVSDATGSVYGGHFVSGTVHTTVELVLGSIDAVVSFDRVHDDSTGYRELVVDSAARED